MNIISWLKVFVFVSIYKFGGLVAISNECEQFKAGVCYKTSSHRLNHEEQIECSCGEDTHCTETNKISWYKGNTQLPNENVSSLIIMKNGALISSAIREGDEGNYTCIIQHEKKIRTVIINLILNDQTVIPIAPGIDPVKPRISYKHIGENVSFTCRGKIGKTDGKVYWIKKNTMAKKLPRHKETNERHGRVMTTHLEIYNIQKEDFGNYTCIIMNSHLKPAYEEVQLIEGDPPQSYEAAIIIICTFTLMSAIIITIYCRWNLPIRIFFKDNCTKVQDDEFKLYDIFICFDIKDAEFTMKTLVPTLQDKYKYSCFVFERDALAGDLILQKYAEIIHLSRRFLVVLSPRFVQNNWCHHALYLAVKEVMSLHSRIICVVLEDIPKQDLKEKDALALRQILRVVHNIRWNPKKREQDKFWNKLRLHLPPNRVRDTNYVYLSDEPVLIV